MTQWIENIKDFLLADVKDENETKEMAVLIRLTCFIFAIYYFIVGVTIAFIQHYFLGLGLIAAIGLLAAAFICTYENHTTLGLIVLNAVILIFSSVLALFVGFDMDFHIAIFLNIMLIYFNKSEKMYLKRFYVIFICIYLMVLTQFCDVFCNSVVGEGFIRIFIRSFNLMLFTLGLGISAYSYCMKFNQAEDKLRAINDNLERMANYDPLTTLPNRRHMNDRLSELVFGYNKSGKIFTIAIGDIDFFKKVNDTYGHDTGDYVLSSVANQLKKFMKDKGVVARWGGEEFLFAFENLTIDKAYEQLDQLRKIIEGWPMKFKEYDFNVTMSYGMEEFNDRLGVEATIKRADDKLYKAKTGGRNQVVK